MAEKYPFRKFEDLSRTIKKNLYKLPENIDLIVGVPRSGMIPAYMIGLYLNKRVCTLNEFLENVVPGFGNRMPNIENGIQKVIVVDDSICTGKAMREVRDKLKDKTDYDIIYLAVYTNNVRNDLVDFTFEYVVTPRLFQWNYMNMVWTQKSCFDMDGVLCVDPTEEENDDGDKYREFLLNAKPLFIPQFCINTIVTSRLEKYRKETELWLRNNNVSYKDLIMLDLPSKNERIKLCAHANYKAHVYKKLEDTTIFIESDSRQAQKIAAISGKTVICSSTDEIFYGDNTENEKKVEEKVQIKACASPKEMLVLPEKKRGMTKVSVILPIYNVADYLQECLNTIRYQSFDDIEIICVNDGSTDESLEILQRNAAVDDRLIIINNQECRYAGNARNEGLKVAKGDYVIFLDGDDFFEQDMIRKAYDKISSTQSDICMFKCRTYDNDTHEYKDRDLELRKKYLPDKECFNYQDMPDSIFNVTTGAPWSKIFRKQFILDEGIWFQGTHHYNDFFFVMSAMVSAKRITYIDESFVNYRINRHDSLQANMECNPLEFTIPLVALKEELIKKGVYDSVQKSFMNRCLSTSLYVLLSQKEFEAYKKVYDALKEKYFEVFGLTDGTQAQEIYIKEDFYEFIKISAKSAEEYLFGNAFERKAGKSEKKQISDLKWRCRNFKKAVQDKNEYIEKLKNEIKEKERRIEQLEYMEYCYWETTKSKTYKIGRAITWLPRKIKEVAKG